MQLVRKTDENEENLVFSSPPQLSEDQDHQVPDIEIDNINDLNENSQNTEMTVPNETNSRVGQITLS